MTNRTSQVVRDGVLYVQGAGKGLDEYPIEVGSEQWREWLDKHASFRYETQFVSFTVRKEKRPAGWYWYAYRRAGGKLRSAYVGRAEEVTSARLEAIGRILQNSPDYPSEYMTIQIADTAIQPEATDDEFEAEDAPALAPPLSLPTPLTPLVDRQEDVKAIKTLLERAEVRLVSLVGMGGIGKTRLAMQVALDLEWAFPDGVYFVPLAAISDPERVPSTIASVLGLSKDRNRSATDLLKLTLHSKQLLLVLDNFEQIVTAASALADLLGSCPEVKMLVTSREVLHLTGEHHFAVSPLPFPDVSNLPPLLQLLEYPALDLFVQRARAIAPDLPLDQDNVRAIAEICARLEGLPLAIEMAAARVRLLPPQALLPRLTSRLDVLTRGDVDKPLRQQTLRATLDWSHDLLTDDEQRVLRRCAVFPDGCDLEAAEAICTDFGDMSTPLLDTIASLIDKSFLQPVDFAHKAPPSGARLQLSETVREYALELLAARGELERARTAHAHFYMARAERAEPELYRARPHYPVEQLGRDEQNLCAALSFFISKHDGDRAVRMAAALRWFWYVHGQVSEGLNWTEQALGERVGTEATQAVRKAMYAAGLFAMHLNEGRGAQERLEESAALCEIAEDAPGFARVAHLLTLHFLIKGDVAAAQRWVEASVTFAQQAANSWALATAQSALGVLSMYLRDFPHAHAAFERSTALYSEANDLFRHELTLALMGDVHVAQGDMDYGRAMTTERVDTLEGIGLASPTAYMLYAHGRVALRMDDTLRARFLLNQSLTLFQRLRDPRGMAQVSRVLAQVALHEEDYAGALRLASQCLQHAAAVDAPAITISCLEELADMAVRRGKAAWAAQLWGAAERQREATLPQHRPVEPVDRGQIVQTARKALGTRVFDDAWAAGRSLSPTQVLQEANVADSDVPQLIFQPARPAGLTRRELEVLLLVADGLGNGEIAERLVISPTTVVSYLNIIYKKLGVSSRTAAMRYVINNHLG